MKEGLPEATEAERAQQARYRAVIAETDAMRIAFEALCKLDEQPKRRVMNWLRDAIWNEQEPPF